MNLYFLGHATISDLWLGLVFTLIGILIGALANHFLASRRDLDKEQRAKIDSINAKKEAMDAAMMLTESESRILRKCISADGFAHGRVWIMSVCGLGSWIRAGEHDFADDLDASFAVTYLDAFESLLNRGFFRPEADTLYILTSMGFERAKKEAQQAAPSNPQ